MHELNCFVTLTYAVTGFSLVYRDFQLFMKRLRRSAGGVRFYMSGEYGERRSRPHFHACLFGFDFADKVYHAKSPAGFKLYTSALLSRLWPHGFSTVGAVTFESAAYVARYIMDKQLGDGRRTMDIVDPDTGEVFVREKEFSRCSLKPGIGRPWLDKFYSDVYPSGKCVVNGREVKAPRYYDRVARARGLGAYMELSSKRAVEAVPAMRDSSDSRLEQKEIVLAARLGQLKRSL